jgi:hypothetical protein
LLAARTPNLSKKINKIPHYMTPWKGDFLPAFLMYFSMIFQRNLPLVPRTTYYPQAAALSCQNRK